MHKKIPLDTSNLRELHIIPSHENNRNFVISLSSIICPGSLGIISALGKTGSTPFENGCKYIQ